MKNLKFGVDRANIEDDTAIYKPENLWETIILIYDYMGLMLFIP